ncbi:syntaxin-17 isoform X1 [Bombina bombina]|uniref:syntaxin-17 isoform X1 n=1 Tax=Bombina bombina TaxID=8345 RepID=UPI00235A4815|nr:syntaxin-17 isoform X1 [Bombina bombina]
MLEDEEKVPYRRLEPAVQKFIKVAIPTDLERLKQHRLNIEKFRRCRSWERLHKEHINAGRTVQQLRANIQEMEKLFSRVKMEDIPTLTKAINPIKKLAIASIADFLELHLKSKEELKKQFNEEASLGLHSSTEALCSSESSEQNLYLQYPEIPQEENAAESWDTLEKDLVDLDKLVNEFSHLVHTQQEKIDSIEDHVNTAAVNVEEGTKNLGKAVQYKLSVLPVAGALIGGVVGGPIGLLAGFKVAGIAAALGGGVLGFTGGKLIQRKKETIIKTEQSSSTESQDQELKKVN